MKNAGSAATLDYLQHQGIWLESPTHGAWESQACGLSSCG